LIPRIAVYAAIRHDTYSSFQDKAAIHAGMLKATYDDADWIVEQLAASGFEAANVTVDFDTTVSEGYNVHVPVNGIVGNQMFRVLMVCGGKILTAIKVGSSRPYEDNTRSETDYRPTSCGWRH